MNKIEQASNNTKIDSAYKDLYKAGAVAALIAALIFRRNLDAEWMLLRMIGIIHAGPSALPDTVVDWFTLLQKNALLGLTLLNLFDLVNYALVGLIFLALFAALRRTSPSWIAIASVLSLIGISVYLGSNQAFTMLSLSEQYAAVNTEAQHSLILAAGEAVLVVHKNASYAGSGVYLSFLLVSTAGLIISAVMLRSGIFNKSTAYTGILANGFGLVYYIILAFAPALVSIPLSISAIFLLIWYLRIGCRLWSLCSNKTAGIPQITNSMDRDGFHQENITHTL